MRKAIYEYVSQPSLSSGNANLLSLFRSKNKDLLDNEAIRIDWPFRYSLINDIVEGLLFIHESSLLFHGSLKSTNCVIDSRLVVKITDIGLKGLRNLSKQNTGPPNFSLVSILIKDDFFLVPNATLSINFFRYNYYCCLLLFPSSKTSRIVTMDRTGTSSTTKTRSIWIAKR